MCMIDSCDEFSIVLREEQRKARKEHKCMECFRTINKGEKYLNEGTLFDGRKSTHKTCSHCQVVRKWLTNNCGGFAYGCIREDFNDHAIEYTHIPSLVITNALMYNRWMTKKGTLYRKPWIKDF